MYFFFKLALALSHFKKSCNLLICSMSNYHPEGAHLVMRYTQVVNRAFHKGNFPFRVLAFAYLPIFIHL